MAARSHTADAVQADRSPMTFSRLSREGVIAGTIGAATIALWFLILDLIQGRPLYTPTLLGSVLFTGGESLPTTDGMPISVDVVVQFTFVHWLVFAAVGGIASWLLGFAERDANLGFGILLLFVVLECGFLAGAMVFAKPILQALAWPAVLMGNVLATLTMGIYFWRQHPHLTINP
jgi:hypothetical protein